MTRDEARTHLRRVKHNRSWRILAQSVPGVTIATLRRFLTDDTYVPRDAAILKALGISPLPSLLTDVLGILHGPAKLDRKQKKVFAGDPNKGRGKR